LLLPAVRLKRAERRWLVLTEPVATARFEAEFAFEFEREQKRREAERIREEAIRQREHELREQKVRRAERALNELNASMRLRPKRPHASALHSTKSLKQRTRAGRSRRRTSKALSAGHGETRNDNQLLTTHHARNGGISI
jgi:hypothetical protein